jgi:hypothetical protein
MSGCITHSFVKKKKRKRVHNVTMKVALTSDFKTNTSSNYATALLCTPEMSSYTELELKITGTAFLR